MHVERNCFSSGGVCTGFPCARCGTGRVTTRTMRSCVGCGNEILISPKIAEFARKHGKDLTRWPIKCAACVLEVIFESFASIDIDPLPAPPASTLVAAPAPTEKTCATCSARLGSRYYADVPGRGDLCLVCHATWRKEMLPL